MKREMIPTWEELERHKKLVPEINPAAVIAMLGIKQVGEDVQQEILDVLQREYHLSEGRFCALIVLHQNRVRATISNMLQRLAREGMVDVVPAAGDGRGKVVCLTARGVAFMDEILPPHYLRVTRLMEKLTEAEQKELIRLLHKLGS